MSPPVDCVSKASEERQTISTFESAGSIDAGKTSDQVTFIGVLLGMRSIQVRPVSEWVIVSDLPSLADARYSSLYVKILLEELGI
jgi:hypothetical protein